MRQVQKAVTGLEGGQELVGEHVVGLESVQGCRMGMICYPLRGVRRCK